MITTNSSRLLLLSVATDLKKCLWSFLEPPPFLAVAIVLSPGNSTSQGLLFPVTVPVRGGGESLPGKIGVKGRTSIITSSAIIILQAWASSIWQENYMKSIIIEKEYIFVLLSDGIIVNVETYKRINRLLELISKCSRFTTCNLL